jgi:geranylgeranyl diphosphate synthase type I
MLDPAVIGASVDAVLRDFLDEQDRLGAATPELALFTDLLRDMLAAGGKRLRPRLCVIGWHAVRDDPPPEAVWRVAAALELFHTFALIHDDIMDRSERRRGSPTAHRMLADRLQGRPDADTLGTNTAILLGDLALAWSYELLHTPDLTSRQLATVRPVLNIARIETMIGQHLDLVAARQLTTGVDAAWRIVRLKTTEYTFDRPLQLGAVLAGADSDQLRALSAYAHPLGDAFQLRDDLLGVFGNPRDTGKSVLEDLREGKYTVLVATALDLATPAQATVLRRHLGDPELEHEDAEQVRDILVATGARTAVEEAIDALSGRALLALDTAALRPLAASALRHLVEVMSRRST